MESLWKICSLGLLLFSGIVGVKSASSSKCYSFDDSNEGWTHDGSFYWKWSGDTEPDTAVDPGFDDATGYMWLQNQIGTTQSTGAIISPDDITLAVNDVIAATIFINDPTAAGSLTLNFVDNTTPDTPTLIIANPGSAAASALLTVTCIDGGTPDTSNVQCCTGGYPCTGRFRVDGTVNQKDDLLTIDDITVNNGCDPSVNWCCEFDDAEVCGWSPGTVSNGWKWSGNAPNKTIDALTSSGYIYITDVSNTANSSVLKAVPTTTTFTLSYYFDAYKYDINNRVEVLFTSSDNHVTDLSLGLATTSGLMATVDLPGNGLCDKDTSCSGVLTLRTYNEPGVSFTVGVDKFSMGGQTC